MVKKGLLLLIIMILTPVSTNCFSETVSTPVSTPILDKTTPLPPAIPAWKEDWDKTVAAAKQEGKATIYTSVGSTQRDALREGLERAYGVSLEFVSGRGAELVEKLFTERRAGLYLADFFMMGPIQMILTLKPAAALEPLKPQLVLPEVMTPTTWYGGNLIYLDKEGTYVIGFCLSRAPPMAVNSELVKPEDIKVYKDLLHPKWKGRIALSDPTISGPGQEWFRTVSKPLGLEFMRELAKQEPVMGRDHRQLTEWVARGKYAILVGPQRAAVAEFITAGAPLKYLFTSDAVYAASSEGSIALINRAPHPNAAKVFINWLLTKEGQTIFSKAFLLQSARLDVPTDHLDPNIVREPGVSYIHGNHEDVGLDPEPVVKAASSIFGLGLK